MSDEITLTSANDDNRLQELRERASLLVSEARAYIGQAANYATVLTSFELGRYIVEEEQSGQDRAAYGAHVFEALSSFLSAKFGRGFSRRNLTNMRMFYLAYRDCEPLIWQSPIAKSKGDEMNQIVQSAIRQFEEDGGEIVQSPIAQSVANHAKARMRLLIS